MHCQMSIVVGFHKEPILDASGNVIKEAGLQSENRVIVADPGVINCILKTNQKLSYIFRLPDGDLEQNISELVLSNVHSNILDYYPWLLDYMSEASLMFLKIAGVRPQERILDVLKVKEKKAGKLACF